MSERLAATTPGPTLSKSPATSSPTIRRTILTYVLQALGVLALFALGGAAAGWLWERIWTPAQGGVRDGEWFYEDYQALGDVVDGTTLFVLVGVAAGVVLGVVAALTARRSALLTLAMVVLGSCLASYVTYRVGTSLGPADPHSLAASAEEGARLPLNLTVDGRSPFVFWPLGGLIGLAVTYVITLAFVSPERSAGQEHGLNRNQNG